MTNVIPASYPPLLPIAEIQRRLQEIFPEGTANRNYMIREMAAKTVFVMLYVGAVEGADSWIRPSQVTDMSDEQAALASPEQRDAWATMSLSSVKARPLNAWYAPNSREPIRDETLRTGLIQCQAVIERQGIPTTSAKPKYALNKAFASLFDPTLTGERLSQAITGWQASHLNKAALARLRLMKHGIAAAADSVPVTFPNGEIRTLAPGPSSVIAKAVIETFAPKFLKDPAVLWLSESGNKVVARDEALAKALGLEIDASKALPDIILVDLGSEASGADMLVIFVEVVATDGPISRERKAVLTALAVEAGFNEHHLAFLTAFMDRGSAPFRKAVSELAWGSFAWLASEPDCLLSLVENGSLKLSALKPM